MNRILKRKILLILFLGASLLANQTHYETISLEELVKRSDLIIKARKQFPFEKNSELKLKCDDEGRFIDSHIIKEYKFQILKILYHKSNQKIVKNIFITEADLEDKIYLQKKYYCEGISKSPLYQRFKENGSVFQKKEMILFLQYDKKNRRWVFAVENAFENTAEELPVRKIIRSVYETGK